MILVCIKKSSVIWRMVITTTLFKLSPMNINELERLQEQAVNLCELIEDISEDYCDNNLVSGEQFYVMLRALVDCKLKEFPFDFDTLEEEIDD